MTNFSSAEIVLIITTVFGGIVSVIGAIKTNTGNKKLDDAEKSSIKRDAKLETIHKATNGGLAIALEQIDKLTAENNKLREDVIDFNKRKRIP